MWEEYISGWMSMINSSCPEENAQAITNCLIEIEDIDLNEEYPQEDVPLNQKDRFKEAYSSTSSFL